MRLWAVVLVLSVATACGGAAAPEAEPELAPGSIVAGTSLDLDRALRELRGRPVVVNFWATWCVPCKTEMPRLVEAAGRYGEEVTFLGVNVQDDPIAAERFAQEYRIPFASIADPDRRIMESQQLLGLPVTQFYRADGELAFLHNGEIDMDELVTKIEDLIALGSPARDPSG
jgi:cytochrome c biogenesis protein CcmG, thiol:disulfide interchange protein DsbE